MTNVASYASLQTYAGSGPNYSQQQRDAILRKVPRLAFDALDAYVGGVRAFAPLAETASTVMTVGSAVMGVGHAGYAVTRLFVASDTEDRSEKLRYRAIAVGDFVTALGYVGLAAGMGPWALPLMAVGLATANYATYA